MPRCLAWPGMVNVHELAAVPLEDLGRVDGLRSDVLVVCGAHNKKAGNR
jgi:hypothetical protein